jgi:hypothetical protein
VEAVVAPYPADMILTFNSFSVATVFYEGLSVDGYVLSILSQLLLER